MKVLVTGGVRSGKSRHAEGLLPVGVPVAYVAPGPVPDAEDADWAARVAAHQAARPAHWVTHETRDVAGVLAGVSEPVLVDCLGTWLTGVIDERELWEERSDEVARVVDGLLDELVTALAATGSDVVLVTNEVGLGVVPAHRSGRLFRDLLGTVNQRVAGVCDEVHLVVAGRVLRL
ncbi:bifunctional adenosylcobinamide kinase/adenosylcobinamide-phosphate guanylyltransferase [Nocardioides sp. CER19]|uniref:bifunctional adenosylcobinamide kinase/adenosylcobinamide-phosphate guanylyltransferase n=1 Tax=Nocardioides sp. CER19 TaxID=3038538 RepID=UPI00244A2F5D|nr:bifunctional adenosylcobinamide kinase/adenosylcobinamide-phosphate guanylyltransferase [Nocardioides sp. CER19]MDH2416513.1 bifunctional adenosylcobinamide kinase/adenosylcobinamide-phosphate guanylyltransferase [Nocardioides sp. CER19]